MSEKTFTGLTYAQRVPNGSAPPFDADVKWQPITQTESGGLRVALLDPDTGASPAVINLANAETPTDRLALVAAVAQFVSDGAGAWVPATAAIVPDTTKVVSTAASGDTTVWDPAAGQSVRLQRGTISICGTAAALTPVRIRLTAGAGGTVVAEFRAAIDTTVRGDTQIPFDFGNGVLLDADVNLVVNLDTALTAGACVVNVSGIEV